MEDQAAQESVNRRTFWRHVMREHNFKSNDVLRQKVLRLTQEPPSNLSTHWLTPDVIPTNYMECQKVLYYQVFDLETKFSAMIKRDVARTFSIFNSHNDNTAVCQLESQQQALFHILNAIATVEDGYYQGMNFIAAVLLVEGIHQSDAYAIFLYLLQHQGLSLMFNPECGYLHQLIKEFEQLLSLELPELNAHFTSLGFYPLMYCVEWMTTLYSSSCKLELTRAIFDLYLSAVDNILLRVGIAILRILEPQLLSMDFEDLLMSFKALVKSLGAIEVITTALGDCLTLGTNITTLPKTITQRKMMRRTLSPEFIQEISVGNLDFVAKKIEDSRSIHVINEIFYFAVCYGNVLVVEYLIQVHNADVGFTDIFGMTPLHYCIWYNQPNVARVLLGYCVSGSDTFPLKADAVSKVLQKQVCLYCNCHFRSQRRRVGCQRCGFLYCESGDCFRMHHCSSSSRRGFVGTEENSIDKSFRKYLDNDSSKSIIPTTLNDCTENDWFCHECHVVFSLLVRSTRCKACKRLYCTKHITSRICIQCSV